MAVITVACVVGVVSASTIGPLGRLHHGAHGTFIHNRHGVSSEVSDDVLAAIPPPPPPPFSPPRKPRPRLVVFEPLPGIQEIPFEERQNAFTGVVMPTMTLAANTLNTEPLPTPPRALDTPPVVNFQVAAVSVPEPGTWAMMVLGFSAIAVALRRRRRRAGYALPLEQGLVQ